MKKHYTIILLGCLLLLAHCAKIPDGAKAVSPFDKEKYLGKWYEIARLDFKFEKNLNNTTAEYTLADNNNMIQVTNKGFNYKKNEWQTAEGKAKFRGNDNIAELKVSFFGPFYSPYNVIALDENYRYALVAGKNLDYLWILSRDKTIPEEVKTDYLEQARSLGYKTSDLIWVEHD